MLPCPAWSHQTQPLKTQNVCVYICIDSQYTCAPTGPLTRAFRAPIDPSSTHAWRRPCGCEATPCLRPLNTRSPPRDKSFSFHWSPLRDPRRAGTHRVRRQPRSASRRSPRRVPSGPVVTRAPLTPWWHTRTTCSSRFQIVSRPTVDAQTLQWTQPSGSCFKHRPTPEPYRARGWTPVSGLRPGGMGLRARDFAYSVHEIYV